MDTLSMISRIFLGEAMRATPPWARICAGTRSRAITAVAPARSAISAWAASVTSMITPPFSDVGMFPPVHLLFAPRHRQHMVQRDRPLVFDVHGFRQRQHVAQLVDLAHGFIQDGCDNAAMRMPRRPLITRAQIEFADSLMRIHVKVKLKLHAVSIIFAAGKAHVLQ